MTEERADVVVVGAGMAGLSAALTAAEQGSSVLVLEKTASVGGSAALSPGTIWTAADYDELRRLSPHADPQLARILVDDFDAALAWLAGQGVELTPRAPNPYHHLKDRCHGMLPDARSAMSHLAERLSGLGGRLLTDTVAEGLHQDAAGRIEGVRCRSNGVGRVARTGAVVLATGGFQANVELLTRYVGRWADRLILRGYPFNSGDGFLMALDCGAAASDGLDTFYGTHLAAPADRLDPGNWHSVSTYFSKHSLLVNLHGRRFTDESLGDDLSTQETVRQPEGRAFLLFDRRVNEEYASTPVYPGSPAVNRLAAVRRLGGPLVEAGSLADLIAGVEGWGVHGETLEATIGAFNRAMERDQAEQLQIPRRASRIPLAQPPFFALAVLPGITLTLGGVRIDPQARILDRRGLPLPGLFAAGGDAGGVFHHRYVGGLAAALVFGRIAGRGAAQAAQDR